MVDVWFKSKLQDGTDIGFGWTHEEPIVDLLRNYLKSYKDLPISVYQFQNKLRNELRAKSGIMRGREFVMKDMYSIHDSKEGLDSYYNSVIEAYKRCYDRFGIGDETYVTFASGGAFTKFSMSFRRFAMLVRIIFICIVVKISLLMRKFWMRQLRNSALIVVSWKR